MKKLLILLLSLLVTFAIFTACQGGECNFEGEGCGDEIDDYLGNIDPDSPPADRKLACEGVQESMTNCEVVWKE